MNQHGWKRFGPPPIAHYPVSHGSHRRRRWTWWTRRSLFHVLAPIWSVFFKRFLFFSVFFLIFRPQWYGHVWPYRFPPHRFGFSYDMLFLMVGLLNFFLVVSMQNTWVNRANFWVICLMVQKVGGSSSFHQVFPLRFNLRGCVKQYLSQTAQPARQRVTGRPLRLNLTLKSSKAQMPNLLGEKVGCSQLWVPR